MILSSASKDETSALILGCAVCSWVWHWGLEKWTTS